MIEMLLLTFTLAAMPVISSAHTVSTTMLVSMNVISTCSVSIGDESLDSHEISNDDIHCANHRVHRISHHKEHFQHQRYHRNIEHDHDGIELTTIEF
jgi:hypothetical protein